MQTFFVGSVWTLFEVFWEMWWDSLLIMFFPKFRLCWVCIAAFKLFSSRSSWALLPQDMWDLCSLTRDRTWVPCIGRWIYIYIYVYNYLLFLTVLGLHCCVGLSLVAASGGCSLVVVQGLLIAMASLVALHKLQGVGASVAVAHGLSSCGSRDLDCRLSSCGAWA